MRDLIDRLWERLYVWHLAQAARVWDRISPARQAAFRERVRDRARQYVPHDGEDRLIDGAGYPRDEGE